MEKKLYLLCLLSPGKEQEKKVYERFSRMFKGDFYHFPDVRSSIFIRSNKTREELLKDIRIPGFDCSLCDSYLIEYDPIAGLSPETILSLMNRSNER